MRPLFTLVISMKLSGRFGSLLAFFLLCGIVGTAARKKKWNVLADYIWLGLSPSASLPTGAPVNIDLDMQIGEVGGT